MAWVEGGLLKSYISQAFPLADSNGAWKEKWPGERAGRVVIFKFPSEDAARGWYEDPEYQALSEYRRAGTELQFLTMIHGLPHG